MTTYLLPTPPLRSCSERAHPHNQLQRESAGRAGSRAQAPHAGCRLCWALSRRCCGVPSAHGTALLQRRLLASWRRAGRATVPSFSTSPLRMRYELPASSS